MSSNTLTTIISGGQDGADIAALRAAKRVGLATGGMAPTKFWTMHGTDRTLHTLYGLKEIKNVGRGTGLIQRSQANVNNADATLAVRLHASSGTDSTIGYAETGRWAPTRGLVDRDGGSCIVNLSHGIHKPVIVLCRMPTSVEMAPTTRAFCDFIRSHHVRTLNVCGHRDVDEAAVEVLLVALFKAVHETENSEEKK